MTTHDAEKQMIDADMEYIYAKNPELVLEWFLQLPLERWPGGMSEERVVSVALAALADKSNDNP